MSIEDGSHAVAKALMEYSMTRIEHGNAPLEEHIEIIDIVLGEDGVTLNYEPDRLRQFTQRMMEYAQVAVASAGTEVPESGPNSYLFTGLANDVLDEAKVLVDLSVDIKAAVLEFEGRVDNPTMDEFLHEITSR